MERKFSNYLQWEDYINGMYEMKPIEGNEDLIIKAKSLLSDPHKFELSAKRLLIEWPISSDFNLSNVEKNRRAWIGQASCCIEYGVPEFLTRVAWGMMDFLQQKEANKIADKIIFDYELKNNIQCQRRLWE